MKLESATSTNHVFTWQGKPRKLFKRDAKPASPWYIRLHEGGSDKWVNLNTSTVRDAEARAKDLLRGVLQERQTEIMDVLRQRKAPNGTLIGQVITALENASLSAGANTIYNYCWSLQRIVEAVHGTKVLWKDQPLTILDERLIHRYKQMVNEQYEDDEETLMRGQRSANSIIKQARAVFGREAMDFYRMSADLDIPDLKGFLQAPGFRGVRKLSYEPASDELLQKTFNQLEAERDQEPARYLVCWLALGFGLRKLEIAAVQSDWFLEIGGRVHLELRRTVDKWLGEKSVTKNGQFAPKIPVANGAWERIGPLITKIPAGQYVIAGHRSYRIDDVFREVNQWLRNLGWKTQKGVHELRAYAGCQICNTNGLLAGSEWLRHGSIHTTQQYYGRYIRSLVLDRPIPHLGGNLLMPNQQLATVATGNAGSAPSEPHSEVRVTVAGATVCATAGIRTDGPGWPQMNQGKASQTDPESQAQIIEMKDIAKLSA